MFSLGMPGRPGRQRCCSLPREQNEPCWPLSILYSPSCSTDDCRDTQGRVPCSSLGARAKIRYEGLWWVCWPLQTKGSVTDAPLVSIGVWNRRCVHLFILCWYYGKTCKAHASRLHFHNNLWWRWCVVWRNKNPPRLKKQHRAAMAGSCASDASSCNDAMTAAVEMQKQKLWIKAPRDHPLIVCRCNSTAS